jgi:hypothetical protein
MFTFTVHRTAGLVTDVNSILLNLPEAGFYSAVAATKFIKDNPDRYNFSHIVDAVTGKVVKTYPAQLD